MPSIWIRRASAALVAVAMLVATSLASATISNAIDPILQSAYNDCVAKFNAAGLGGIVSQLDGSSHKFSVKSGAGTGATPDSKIDARDGTGTGGTILWNSTDTSPYQCDGVAADPCAALYHEMQHLADYDKGTNIDWAICIVGNGPSTFNTHVPIAEVKVTNAENVYRSTQGLPPRTCYDKYGIPMDVANCAPPPPRTVPGGGCNCSYVGAAQSRGDPHLITFDSARYDFQAVGEFVFVRSTSGSDLEVQVRQGPLWPGLRTVAITTAISANVAGDRVGLYQLNSGVEVHVEGATVDLSAGPSILNHGGVVRLLSDGAFEVLWPDGSDLIVHPVQSWGMTLAMSLNAVRQGAVEGVLGNFDGNPSNDIVVHGGAQIPHPPAFNSLYPTFVDSWRVNSATSLFDYGPGTTTATYTDTTFPDAPALASALLPAEYAAAEAICRDAGVYDPMTLDACILDVALTGQAIFAFEAAATQAIGGTLLNVATPGGTATLLFYGTAGQAIFVHVPFSNVPSGQCANLFLRDPDQNAFPTTCVVNGSGYIDRLVLQKTGLYSLVFSVSGGGTGSVRVVVFDETDQAGTISIGGPAVRASIVVPGAVARFPFMGTANQTVYVDVSSSTLPDDCDALMLLNPNGNVIATGCTFNNGTGSIGGTTLLTTGKYTLVVDPTGATTGQATLLLH